MLLWNLQVPLPAAPFEPLDAKADGAEEGCRRDLVAWRLGGPRGRASRGVRLLNMMVSLGHDLERFLGFEKKCTHS